jgi:PAS domain S-box-containing protein
VNISRGSPQELPLAAFSAIVDLLPEPMLLLHGQSSTIQLCNRAFAALFHQNAADFAGRSFAQLLDNSERSWVEFLRRSARSGQMVLGALTLRIHDTTVDFRCDGIAFKAVPSDSPPLVLVRLWPRREGAGGFTLTDEMEQLDAQMNRREQVENALRKERETLEVTLGSIGDCVIVTESTGRITFLNQPASRLTGWAPQEAMGQDLAQVFRIVNEASGKAVADPVQKVIETNGIVGLANHTVLVARDGRRIPIDDSAAPIRLPDGQLFGVVLIFRDITEQRRAEHARAWLASIIESSDDAIVSKTVDGLITSWNAGAERLFGYPAQEIVGKPITTIVPPELQDQERDLLSRLRRGERVEHFETARVRKDGSRVEISLTVSPIRDSAGAIVGVSKVARDIGERRRVEAALREANRRKDEFLATLAHELRNPLAPIRNAAEIICRVESLPAVAQRACEIITRQMYQLTRLVDDLLEVSRIDAGRVRLQKEVVSLESVLSMAIESCQPALDVAGHRLETALPHEPVHVEGDSIRLAQVFANVLGNAIKYTPNGGHIQIRLTQQGEEAVVSIIDSGIGIPPAMLEQVFELFAQMDRSYERTGGGLGIGLALSRRLVEMHGGTIAARSAGADLGSEFIIRLPAATAAVLPDEPLAPVPPRGVRKKILIADDNNDAAMSLEILLKLEGHDVRVAGDGPMALELAEGFHPDVAVLDIGMPGLNGYEVARRMRQRPWASSTLMVALTGWGQEADRQKAKEAGFHRHLVKPVDPHTILALLSETFP